MSSAKVSIAPEMPSRIQSAAIGPTWAKRRKTVAMHIEKAALELFVERGVDNVTVEEIAAAAGISRRTFYRYFETPEHVLTEMPHRSLLRTWRDVQARPAEEPLLEAFLNALRSPKLPETDKHIHVLVYQIMRDSADAWWRAIGRMNPSAVDIYRDMIADRLRVCGHDPAAAGVLGAAIHAILSEVCRECATLDTPVTVEAFERRLRSCIAILAEEQDVKGAAQAAPQREKAKGGARKRRVASA